MRIHAAIVAEHNAENFFFDLRNELYRPFLAIRAILAKTVTGNDTLYALSAQFQVDAVVGAIKEPQTSEHAFFSELIEIVLTISPLSASRKRQRRG